MLTRYLVQSRLGGDQRSLLVVNYHAHLRSLVTVKEVVL
jgi:hypothetical protein